jgi:hypothetical protein
VTETTDTAVHPDIPEILSEVVDSIKYLDVPSSEIKDAADPRFADLADAMTEMSLLAGLMGQLEFGHVVSLAFFQAIAEEDPAERRKELVKLAAVVVEWIRAIDERSGK